MEKETLITKIEDAVIHDIIDIEHRNEQTVLHILDEVDDTVLQEINGHQNDLTTICAAKNPPRQIESLSYTIYRNQVILRYTEEVAPGSKSGGHRSITLR